MSGGRQLYEGALSIGFVINDGRCVWKFGREMVCVDCSGVCVVVVRMVLDGAVYTLSVTVTGGSVAETKTECTTVNKNISEKLGI